MTSICNIFVMTNKICIFQILYFYFYNYYMSKENFNRNLKIVFGNYENLHAKEMSTPLMKRLLIATVLKLIWDLQSPLP